MNAFANIRHGMLESIETSIGATAIRKIRSEAKRTGTSDANSGTVLATVNLPAELIATAACGQSAKNCTREDASAEAPDPAGHWLSFARDGTTCHLQGTMNSASR